MSIIDKLHVETKPFHADADADAHELLGPVEPVDYRRFLVRCLGFVAPVERAVSATAGLAALIDLRRFRKHELIERDLLSLRMTPTQLREVSYCTVPLFDSPDEALGWAYVIERKTLVHNHLFRHLATIMPGEIAFASLYLKCYLGAVGETWRALEQAVEHVVVERNRTQCLVDSAKLAFRTYRSWRTHLDEREHTAAATDEQLLA